MSPSLAQETDGRPVLFMTRSGDDLFIGIRDVGIRRITENGLRPEWEDENLHNVRSCSALLTGDNLWLSKDGGSPVNLYRHRQDHTIPVPKAGAEDALNMFYPIGDGYLLVITNRGVFRQHIGSGEALRLHGEGLEGEDKLGITLRDRLGALWVLANYGTLRKYTLEGDRFTMQASWRVGNTDSIWDDAAGNVYLLQAHAIIRFTPDGQRTEIPVGGEVPDFWFCGQFASGRPYFLSDEAVWLLDEDFRFIRQDLGVPSPACIWEDARGDWWIGSRTKGIFRYDTKGGTLYPIDLGGKWADRSIRSIGGDAAGNIWVAARFDYTRIAPDGKITVLRGDRTANNTNSLAVTDNGTPVFGSTGRLAFFLSGVPGEYDVPVSLDGLIVNGQTVMTDLSSPPVLPPGTRQLSFYFSGKNFNPDVRPVFQYRLDGYDKDWVYAGLTLRAGYSGLPSGRYTFRVRVLRPDGEWSPGEKAVSLRIRPSPWLSVPALILYAVLLLGMMFLGIRWFIQFRVNREKLEIAEQEKGLVEQISQERTTFFTNVSHEFRTPLSLIYGPVRELGKSPTLSEENRKLVRLVERNSERMLRLTDQLLHFNQTRANRESLSVIRTDLTVLLRRMLENFEYMFQQKGLRVATVLPAEQIVWCDREKVERIVFNLLSNAVKYTPEHGEITVSARTEDGRALVEVADTGIGIAPDKAERIFQRYERLGEQVGGALPSGFGIGLSYARHLAGLHKGDLSVRANDPLGSVFTFAFPSDKEAYTPETVWQEAENSEPELQSDEVPSGDKEAVVLLAEDNPDMREYIRGFLGESYKVVMAGDGEEAWKLIRLSAPDLIVSDVMMPYKDGYTLCMELKNDPEYCHIPLILLTAKADMEDRIHGLELGADGYLGKPFDPALLSALVANLLAGRRRLHGLLADRTSATKEEAPAEDGLSAQDRAFLEKCWRIIDQHISEEEFGVTVLSMEMGMSRTSIFSKLKALTGQSPQNYLTNYRLNRAMELLKTREYNISEVAYKVGFATLTGFSRSFKNKFGVPPSSI